RRVVDRVRRVAVNDLHFIAVADQRLALLIDTDGAVERAVYGIALQQAGAFHQVVIGLALAHDDRTQTQRIAAAGFFDQQTRHQAADAAEAEQHDILRLADEFGVDADQVGNLLTHEIVNGYARFFCVFIEYGDAAG